MRFAVVLPVAAAAVMISASAIKTDTVSVVDSIMRRQTTDCTTECNAVQSQQAACGTVTSCLCNDAFAQLLLQCANCSSASDPTSATDLQTGVNQYLAGCAVGGKTLGPYTVNGFTTTGGSSAAATATRSTTRPTSASGSATASVSGSVSSVPTVGTTSISIPAFATSAGGSAASAAATSSQASGLTGAASVINVQALGAGFMATIAGVIVGFM